MVDDITTIITECNPSCAVRHLAYNDVLTGLPNRVLFNDRIKHALDDARRNGKKFAVMFLDLDHFKHINDTHGHSIGDGLLKAVATRLRTKLRECDTLARMGGDEFTVILENIRDIESVEVVANKVIYAFNEPYEINEYTIQASTSVGIAMYDEHATTVDTLLKYADKAMYDAKKSGRNRYSFYTG